MDAATEAIQMVTIWDALVRMVIACALSAGIGWDRERRGRAAGLRTHILVGLGAAGFAVMALDLSEIAGVGGRDVVVDPSRVVAAVVGGVGFLAAGAIIRSGGDIRGLTTAAGLWVTAAIGTASGLGAFGVAGVIAALGVFVIVALRQIEPKSADAPAEPRDVL